LDNVLKIKFVDFWYGFHSTENYFYKLLALKYNVEISDTPQILIYSCYGKEYLKYNCTKIFYTAENLRPDFTGCDFAITFDYNNDRRHFRLPLYAIYIDQAGSVEQMLKNNTRDEAVNIWRGKTKFCCMVVSNGHSKKRLDFFEKLSKYKMVDSGGKIMNNVGGPIKDKMDFIKDYRFVIAFENASSIGYTTEKLIEPFLTNSIPIYWGNPVVHRDFNEASFIHLHKLKTEEELIAEIIKIDSDEEKAIEILTQPKFLNGKIPDDIDKSKLASFLDFVVNESKDKTPVAKTWKSNIHLARVFYLKLVAIKNFYFYRMKNYFIKVLDKKSSVV
jgi:alpha(1,3/1,4) fucosyltransferase